MCTVRGRACNISGITMLFSQALHAKEDTKATRQTPGFVRSIGDAVKNFIGLSVSPTIRINLH